MISSAGALSEKLQAGPHSRAPYKLFLLLDGVPPESITSIPDCMLDKWSRAFLKEHPDLTRPAALVKLQVVAMLLALDTHLVESGHAWYRRIVSQRVQTWRALFDDTSAAWQIKRMCEQELSGPPSNKAREEHDDSSIVGTPRTQAGGPWRAFVRSQHNNDLRAVAAAYDPENLPESVRSAGEDPRQRGIQGHTGNTFGPTAREARRSLMRTRLQELMDGVSDDARSPQEAIEQFVTSALDFGLHVRDVARGARMQHHVASKLRQACQQKDSEDIAEHAAERTRATTSELIGMAPGSEVLASSFRAVPALGCKALEMLPKLSVDEAADVRAWLASKCGRYSKLSGAIDTIWGHSCRLLPPAERPDGSSDDEESECWRFGFCICSPVGKVVFSFATPFCGL